MCNSDVRQTVDFNRRVKHALFHNSNSIFEKLILYIPLYQIPVIIDIAIKVAFRKWTQLRSTSNAYHENAKYADVFRTTNFAKQRRAT